MPAGAQSRPTTNDKHSTHPRPDEVLRFRKSERQLHWAVAGPFMVSYASALILVAVYNPYPDRPFRELVSLVHKISGIGLIVLPLVTILRHRRDFRAHLLNIRHAWRWSWDDVRWLFLMGPAAVNSKIELPRQGKFNAAEKINFIVLTSTYPLYIVTGLLIWMPSIAILAWFLHFSMAVAATPLLLGHVFMATINPDTRVGLSGMMTGFVNRQWAKHHYRLWYDEHYEQRVGRRTPAHAVRQAKPRLAREPRTTASRRSVRPAAPPHPPPAVVLLSSLYRPTPEVRPDTDVG